jgi:signal transduction histidine kinase
VNAALVFVAIAAVFAVSALRNRERRLTLALQRRVDQEAALREAAEALAAAFTVDDVTQQIVQSGLQAAGARGAFVEQIVAARGEPGATLVVRASAGIGGPAAESVLPYAGSCTELVLRGSEPMLFADLRSAGQQCAATILADGSCSAIVIPLGHGGAPIGALFLLSAEHSPFGADDLARAHTFGHLAALAYEKVRLLDEARSGREQLMRVIKSRSRLMRGFSHDVKNPLGAADGYAELLSAGIYGELNAEQHESITRLRRSLHAAIDLIDDLHEMARAETGNIHLSLKLVDLGEIVRGSGDEYRAAAEASGLALSVDVPATPLIIETDRVRVRQILSNLLSNAIKYTDRGSIALRARREPAESDGEPESWAAIEVRDTGRGIEPEKWDAIFEEFVRLGASEKSGAGLGLAVSQRLALALRGRITVRSEVGRGSTFTLRLPLRNLDGDERSASGTGADETEPMSAMEPLSDAGYQRS